jgi:hypothetical protein
MGPGVFPRAIIHCWFHTELLYFCPSASFASSLRSPRQNVFNGARWGCIFTKAVLHQLVSGMSWELSSLPVTHFLNRSYCLFHFVTCTKGLMGKWINIHTRGSLVWLLFSVGNTVSLSNINLDIFSLSRINFEKSILKFTFKMKVYIMGSL